jgi:RHS repeat-associated protein
VTNTYTSRLRTGLSLAQPTGRWTNGFAYDAAKRLTNVTSPAGAFAYTLGATSDASPLPRKLALPNGSYVTNAYDAAARLRFTRLNTSSHVTLDAAEYGYNAAHQRITFTNAAGTWWTNSYDRIGQLRITDSSVNTEDRGYTYDAAWNMIRRTNYVGGTPSTTSYTVNGKNELTKVNTADYHYDGNGNRIDIREDLPFYEYDDENRLVVIEDDGSDWRSEFTYDGAGRLRERKEYDGSPGNWTLIATTRYVYDGWRVIQERDGNNTPTVSYTRGTDLSGTLEGAGGIGGLLARSHGYSGGTGHWSTHNFYHADGNGNITYVVNSSQGLAASYRYDPFGNTLASSGSLAGANVYRFSSKELHVRSGLYYYGHRFYDPPTQRWPNRDPLQELGGINLYQFVGHDPLGHRDSDGASWGWVPSLFLRAGALAASEMGKRCSGGCPTPSKPDCEACCRASYGAASAANLGGFLTSLGSCGIFGSVLPGVGNVLCVAASGAFTAIAQSYLGDAYQGCLASCKKLD